MRNAMTLDLTPILSVDLTPILSDGHRVRKLCPLCVADFVDFKEKKDPAEQAGKPTRDAKSRYWDTILPMRNKKTIIRCA